MPILYVSIPLNISSYLVDIFWMFHVAICNVRFIAIFSRILNQFGYEAGLTTFAI